MIKKIVYNICRMCPAQCPVQVEVENEESRFVMGNLYASGINGALCPRGAGAISMIRDDERPQFPMIRKGNRGEGKWTKASWKEALDYFAEKIESVRSKHGAKSILWSDGDRSLNELHKAFMSGLGSPNYCNENSAGLSNVSNASFSLFGFDSNHFVYDFLNSKHVVLQARNMFGAIEIKDVNDLLDGLEEGGHLTVIDVRSNITAGKADKFLMIKPGTDYALNLAVIHVILEEKLYNSAKAAVFINDLEKLQNFVRPYTPAFAEAETGIKADDIIALAKTLAKAAPAVIWYPGQMAAKYKDSFYVCRTAFIINALLGSIGAKGGVAIAATPEDAGGKGLKKLTKLVLKIKENRADGLGWMYPHLEDKGGLLHLAFKAIQTQNPYPIKAYIACGSDPLSSYPDPEAIKKTFENLDFLVSMPYCWSDIAWHSDLILPLSPYLESDDILKQVNGLHPCFFIARKCSKSKFDTLPSWQIISEMAKRLNIVPLMFNSIEKIWAYQLQETGVKIEDFDKTGFVGLSKKLIYLKKENIKFNTPSGKIEIISEKMEKQNIPSLLNYAPKGKQSEGQFRLTIGRCSVHTPAFTRNNDLLHEQMPENKLWLNSTVAEKLNISNDEIVLIKNKDRSGKIKVFLTEFIHPEAVFMVHGFGSGIPPESRTKEIGVADNILMPGGLDIWDVSGGGLALQEHFVSISKIT